MSACDGECAIARPVVRVLVMVSVLLPGLWCECL